MQKEIELVLNPKDASNDATIKHIVAQKLRISYSEISDIKITRRSIDARQKSIKVNLRVLVASGEALHLPEKPEFQFQNVNNKPEVIIVGAGPAGLFAALELIQLGIKPIILERGKKVSERKVDIAQLSRNHIVDSDSNYCFGEGGAGTFSDGKLYTRSRKKGNNKKVLQLLQLHGAKDNILIDAHPHIGTNILPRIITSIRETIISAGGEILFGQRVTDFIIDDNKIQGVITQKGEKLKSKAVILATGHSSRDIYELLHKKNILLEAKSFAMGVRVEHSQALIDSIQYHCEVRSEYLPAAAYNYVSRVNERGVYSFCMCPGGYIVPSATAQGEIVVNGMSPSGRNSVFANSGIVVEIRNDDLIDYQQFGVLAGLKFQQDLEKMAFENAKRDQTAPAQRMVDFIENRFSNTLPDSSYYCGTISSPLQEWMPTRIKNSLQQGFKDFGKKSDGYLTNDAIILGVESRTSSPVRIPREKDSLEHPQVKGLFPAGEGAGYAGGIVSSAIDGQRCAQMAAKII